MMHCPIKMNAINIENKNSVMLDSKVEQNQNYNEQQDQCIEATRENETTGDNIASYMNEAGVSV